MRVLCFALAFACGIGALAWMNFGYGVPFLARTGILILCGSSVSLWVKGMDS